MQKPSLKTILISVLIIAALFTSIYFPYKFKQLSNDFLEQTNQYGELLNQINDLQKEVRELKSGDGEIGELKGWKVYRNEEHGYEVKYPNGWLITKEQDQWEKRGFSNVTFEGPENMRKHLEKVKGIISEEVKELVIDSGAHFQISYERGLSFKCEGYPGLRAFCCPPECELIKIAGKQATKTLKENVGNIGTNWQWQAELDIEEPAFRRIFFLLKYNPKNDPSAEKIFNQILSTFKFIDQKEANISNWKTYSDSNAKFTLKYPLEKPFVLVEKIDSLGNAPAGYDKDTALIDQRELEKGNYGEEVHSGINKKVIKIDNKYGKSFMVLVEYEICNVSFIRELIFYNNNYRVIIRLSSDKEKIISSMPEYFISGEKSCGTDEIKIWDFDNNALDNFYQTLKDGKGSDVAQSWYNTFNNIIGTIKFIE